MKVFSPFLNGTTTTSGSFNVPNHPGTGSIPNPLTGSLFHDDTDGILKIYTGTQWQVVGEQVAATPLAQADIEYLLVAGGGGGGDSTNATTGGGGAGGLLSSSLASVISGSSFTITVGGGGSTDTSGDNSSIIGATISTIIALGGGQGSGEYLDVEPAGDGGSGGGGGNGGFLGGSGTVGQGNDGGDSQSGGRGAGGGGAGVAGSNSTGDNGGNGGDGIQSSITGTSIYYAGGGGGAGSTTAAGGSGGQGGGGNGESSNSGDATAGTSNTGGGGGGAFTAGATAGGSGVAIFAYDSGSIGAIGGIELKASNGRRIHQFNSSGTFKISSTLDFSDPNAFPSTVTSPSIYLNPRSIGQNGSFTYIPDYGSVGREFYVKGSGTKINTTGSLADAIDTPYGSGNRGFMAGNGGNSTVYSDYNTNQNCSFNCFFRYDPTFETALEYPLIGMITPLTTDSSTSYYGGWQIAVWRGGLSDTGKIYSQIYDSSGNGLLTNRTTSTVTSGDQWYMVTVTLSYGSSGVQKIYINGTLDTTSAATNITTFGGTSNRVHLGESYASTASYNLGGMTFGVSQWWFGTELSSSEVTNLYNYYKSRYGLP